MLMKQSTIHGKYHRKPVTYSVTLMQGFENSREQDTMQTTYRQCTSQVAVDDVTWKSHKTTTQINHTNELHKK